MAAVSEPWAARTLDSSLVVKPARGNNLMITYRETKFHAKFKGRRLGDVERRYATPAAISGQ
jgi:hypothetical protein